MFLVINECILHLFCLDQEKKRRKIFLFLFHTNWILLLKKSLSNKIYEKVFSKINNNSSSKNIATTSTYPLNFLSISKSYHLKKFWIVNQELVTFQFWFINFVFLLQFLFFSPGKYIRTKKRFLFLLIMRTFYSYSYFFAHSL